jgi:hypothetical protein
VVSCSRERKAYCPVRSSCSWARCEVWGLGFRARREVTALGGFERDHMMALCRCIMRKNAMYRRVHFGSEGRHAKLVAVSKVLYLEFSTSQGDGGEKQTFLGLFPSRPVA